MRFTLVSRLSAVLVAVGLAAFVPSAHGADYGSSGNVSVTFKTAAADKPVDNVFYQNGNKNISIAAADSTPSSASFTYRGDAKMDILRPSAPADPPASTTAAPTTSAPAAGTAPKTSPSGGTSRPGATVAATGPGSIPMAAVGNVTFPGDGDYIVYISTDDDGSVKATAINPKADFPVGSVKVTNSTSYRLSVRIGDVNVPLKGGASLVLPPFKGNQPFPLIVLRADKDPPVGAYQQMIAKPSPGKRTTALITVGNRAQADKNQDDVHFNLVLKDDSG